MSYPSNNKRKSKQGISRQMESRGVVYFLDNLPDFETFCQKCGLLLKEDETKLKINKLKVRNK